MYRLILAGCLVAGLFLWLKDNPEKSDQNKAVLSEPANPPVSSPFRKTEPAVSLSAKRDGFISKSGGVKSSYYESEEAILNNKMQATRTEGSFDSTARMDLQKSLQILYDPRSSEQLHKKASRYVLDWAGQDKDRYYKLQILSEAWQQLSGEDLQFAMKALAELSDIGGNEQILEAALNPAIEMSINDVCRILSYLNGEQPLSESSVNRLASAYLQDMNGEIGRACLEALSRAGGSAGVQWLLTRMTSSNAQVKEREVIIDSLGRSGSDAAFNSLHSHLNQIINDESASEDYKNALRHAILSLRDQLALQATSKKTSNSN